MKMVLNFVVFLFAIMIGLMGSAYGTRLGIRYEPNQYQPPAGCYFIPWVKCGHLPSYSKTLM
jgi:hypothetical protein